MFETEPLGFYVEIQPNVIFFISILKVLFFFYGSLAYSLCFRSFFQFQLFFSFFRFTFVAMSGGRGHTFWTHIDEWHNKGKDPLLLMLPVLVARMAA